MQQVLLMQCFIPIISLYCRNKELQMMVYTKDRHKSVTQRVRQRLWRKRKGDLSVQLAYTFSQKMLPLLTSTLCISPSVALVVIQLLISYKELSCIIHTISLYF